MINDISDKPVDEIMEYIENMPYCEQVLYYRSSGQYVNNSRNSLASEAEACGIIKMLRNFVSDLNHIGTHAMTSRKVGNCFEYFVERNRR